MNRTNVEHAVFAVGLQILLWPVCGLAIGGIIASSLFFGREYAQVEYKVRSRTGRSLTDMMPWHVLKPSLWSKDAVLDTLFPILGNSTVYYISTLL